MPNLLTIVALPRRMIARRWLCGGSSRDCSISVSLTLILQSRELPPHNHVTVLVVLVVLPAAEPGAVRGALEGWKVGAGRRSLGAPTLLGIPDQGPGRQLGSFGTASRPARTLRGQGRGRLDHSTWADPLRRRLRCFDHGSELLEFLPRVSLAALFHDGLSDVIVEGHKQVVCLL